MAALRKVVTAGLALTALAATGCGKEAQDGEKGGGRAQYVVQANLFCESLRTELVPAPQPRTHPRLGRYLERADDAMRTAATGLHDARRTLGAEATAPVEAFDREVDAVVGVIGGLSDEATKAGLNPGRESQQLLIAAAGEARRAFAVWRRTAQAAGLRRCGLGGEDLADAVLYATYRAQYLRIQDATFRSLRRTPFRRSDSLARYLSKSRQYLKIRSAEYRRVLRLAPPAILRPPHDAVVTRFKEAIAADRRLQSALHRGRTSAITLSTARLQRRDAAYFKAERRLRRILDGRGTA